MCNDHIDVHRYEEVTHGEPQDGRERGRSVLPTGLLPSGRRPAGLLLRAVPC
jgi:hypothetical protein